MWHVGIDLHRQTVVIAAAAERGPHCRPCTPASPFS